MGLKMVSKQRVELDEVPELFFRIPKWKLKHYGSGLEDKIAFTGTEEAQLASAQADEDHEYVVFRAVPVSETSFSMTQIKRFDKK